MTEKQDALVKHQPKKGRFVIETEGKRAGYVKYKVLEDGTWDFYSTVVDPKFEGRGLGSKLVDAALDHAEGAGNNVKGTCPFVAAKLKKRAENGGL